MSECKLELFEECGYSDKNCLKCLASEIQSLRCDNENFYHHIKTLSGRTQVQAKNMSGLKREIKKLSKLVD